MQTSYCELSGRPKSRVFSLVGGGYYIGKARIFSLAHIVFQIDKRSKSANKRGTVFLVQYNGTWANGKWEGEGVGCFSCERELITSGPKDSGLRVQKTHIYHHAANE